MDSKQALHRPGGTGNPDRINIMATTYIIQQLTRHQYEDVQSGEFETQAGAIAAMHELETYLEWRDLRVVADTDGRVTDVIEYGLRSDE